MVSKQQKACLFVWSTYEQVDSLNCFFLECEYPFIDKPMFVNEPAVASVRLLSLGWLPRVPLIKSLTRRANSNMQAKERLYRQGDCVIKNEQND